MLSLYSASEKAVVDAKHVEAEREKEDTKKNLELLRQQLEDLELKEVCVLQSY